MACIVIFSLSTATIFCERGDVFFYDKVAINFSTVSIKKLLLANRAIFRRERFWRD